MDRNIRDLKEGELINLERKKPGYLLQRLPPCFAFGTAAGAFGATAGLGAALDFAFGRAWDLGTGTDLHLTSRVAVSWVLGSCRNCYVIIS